MTAETRFMRTDQHTINGLTAYKLGRTSGGSEVHVQHAQGSSWAQWGVRVFIRHPDGSEEEQTYSYEPEATVLRISPGQSLLSANWDFGGYWGMLPCDALVIRVYSREGISGDWDLDGEFISENLGYASLEPCTWTFRYYVNTTWDNIRGIKFMCVAGGSTLTRVENIDYVEGEACVLPGGVMLRRLRLGVGL